MALSAAWKRRPWNGGRAGWLAGQAGWTSPATEDTAGPHFEALSNASGLTPPRWLDRLAPVLVDHLSVAAIARSRLAAGRDV